MHPVLDQLHKILQLEIKDGYPNKAVIGGLPKLLTFWEPNARRVGLDGAFVDIVVAQLKAYPDLPTDERSAAIQALLERIANLGTVAPTPARPAPSAERPARPRPTPKENPPTPVEKPQTAEPQPAAQDTSGLQDFLDAPDPQAELAPPAPPPQAQLAPTPKAERPKPPAAPKPPKPPAAQKPAAAPKPPKPPRAQPEKSAQPTAEGSPPPPKPRPYDDQETPVDPRPRRSQGPQPLRAEVPLNTNVGLDAPLTVLRGIGPETAKLYERLGLFALRDILRFFPRRYDDYSRLKTINRLQFGEECTIIATVWESRVQKIRGGASSLTKVVLSDTTGMLEVTFFNQPFLASKFTPGRQVVMSGKVNQYLGHLTLVPDEWEDLDRELLSTGRIVPVYRGTADLKQKNIRKITAQVVKYWAPRQPDPLPLALVQRAGVLAYGDALNQIHYPDSAERLEAARHRLAFEELLLLQLGMLRQRQDWQAASGKPIAVSEVWYENYLASFPFRLTGAQRRVLGDIRRDVALSKPMNRLLQGDVGAGKTAVAAAALAMAVQAGMQAAIMAPTSILAEQHYRNLVRLLEPVATPDQIRLLQGATPNAEKEQIYAGLKAGTIKVIIGTHALIEGPVTFANLGVAVVDEQHRFGVAQRAALREKGQNPHLLVMTATPIPRSLALTVYGDLDLSVLDEMPPGRQPIQTYLVRANEHERAYAFVRSQVQKGRQAFLIFPLVEESEKIDAKAAVAEHARLQKEVFPELKLGLLHGRLKPDEKEAVMTQFRAGDYHVLVATSVVEVGVDVPNATVIVIEGANRFGLAQLHQFRGRVGRGEHPSFCLLVSDAPNAEKDERLQVMVQSQNGFVLAEKDLELRGPGDFLGTRQSGFAEMTMARLTDVKTIEKARREARLLFEQDPELQQPEHQALAQRFTAFWSPGAGDVS